MTFEEFVAWLKETDPEGAEEKLGVINAQVNKRNKENQSLRERLRTTEGNNAKLIERIEKIADHLGIELPTDTDGEVDLEGALEALQDKKGGKGGNTEELAELTRTVNQLKRNLDKITKEKDDIAKAAGEEKRKRHNLLRDNAVLAALTDGKAVKPGTLLHVVNKYVKVNDDDTLTFVNEAGDEMGVAEGVKAWLASNPEFVVGQGAPGAGSAGAGGGGKVDDVERGRKMAEERNKAAAPTPQGGFDPWATKS